MVFVYYPQDFFRPQLEKHQIQIVYAPKASRIGLGVLLRLVRTLHHFRPEVIFSLLNTPNFYASVSSGLSKNSFRVVTSFRSKTDFSRQSKLAYWRDRYIICRSDSIIANSHHEREGWSRAVPHHRDKWHTLYNIVDLDRFRPRPGTTRSDRFIAVGRIERFKRPDLLLDALEYLAKNGLPVPRVDWFGRHHFAVPSFQRFADAFLARLERSPVANHFRVHQPVTDLAERLPTYRALVHPSVLEGLPNVICESLSSGTPVITSSVLDHPRLIGNNERGILFTPDSAPELARCLQQMQRMDDDTYGGLQSATRSYAEVAFAGTRLVNRLEAILFPSA